MAKGRNVNRRLLTLERQRKALELRKAGATYVQIAEQLEYRSGNGAYQAVQAALREHTVEPTEEFRKVQFERLNYMIMKLWPRVQAGEDKAISQVANLMAQQDKLMGADAPVEHKITHQGAVLVIEGAEDDYVKAMQQMADSAGAADVIDAEVISDGVPELPPPAPEPESGVVNRESEPVLAMTVPEPTVDLMEEPPCPRYVRSANPERAAEELCARCPHPKSAH